MQNKEYLVNVGGKSYRDALAHCKTRGGKLVEPKSDQANNDIVDLAKAIEIEGNGVWIGINDKSQEGNFTYASDGKSVNYTNWNFDQPDDVSNNEGCGILWNRFELKWNVANCSEKNSFICERYPGKYNHWSIQQGNISLESSSLKFIYEILGLFCFGSKLLR